MNESPFYKIEESQKIRILRLFIEEYLLNQSTPEDWDIKAYPKVQLMNNAGDEHLSEEDLLLLYKDIKNQLLRVVPVPVKTSVKVFTPSMSFSDLVKQEFPKARYTLEPFFENGTVNMVSAPPNTWKSWLLFLFSAHIAEGTNALTKFVTEKSKVMIVNEEDSHRSIQDRYKILGITNPLLPIYFRIAQGSKLEKVFVDNLIKEAKEKGITVIIFDSLRSMHEEEENDSTAMQKVMDILKSISREGITVIFTHHHRKKSMFGKGDESEASRGSSAINAAISGHISLEEEDRESGKYLVIRHLKSKAGEKLPPFEIKIVKKEDGGVNFHYDGEFKPVEKKLMDAKNSIMNELGDGNWKTAKDFIALGVANKNIVRTALDILKKEHVIVSITRKEAMIKQITIGSQGKGNELLYSINKAREEGETIEQDDIDFKDFDNITKDAIDKF